MGLERLNLRLKDCSKTMLNALLFDLDGTMANTDPVHFQTWQDVLKDYDFTIDRPFYQAHFSGRRNLEILNDLIPQLTPEQAEEFSQYKEAEFRRRASQLHPMPGLMDCLDWATRQGLQLATVTNAPRPNAEFMLTVLGVADRFPTVVIGDELPAGKPDPLPYQLGLSRLGVQAEEAIAFEDSPSGIRSAVAAGIVTVAIASTHDPEDLYEVGATLVIPDFTDPRLEEILTWRQGSSRSKSSSPLTPDESPPAMPGR